MVRGHAVTQLMAYYTCPLSTCTSHEHILYLSKGHNPDELRALSWNIMGETRKGWADARRIIVEANIKGNDIVFLQEVQWVVTDTHDTKELFVKLATRAQYKVGPMTRSEHRKTDTFILYNSKKLQCEGEDEKEEEEEEEEEEEAEDEDEDTLKTKLTTRLQSMEGWTEDYSQRLCVQVFTLKGKGDTSKFVAISLHAPYKNRGDNQDFCELVRDFIEEVDTVHRLPVLVGGDFNTDISCWKESGFKGLDYEAGRIPIDFITMKVCRKKNHLEIAEVQKMKCDEIAIPESAETIEVHLKDGSKMTVAECKEKSIDNFSKHLCGYHMPLTVVVKYSPNAIQSKGSKQESMSREKLEAEIAKLKREIQEMTVENEKVKEQHQAEIASLKKQHKEEIDSLKLRLLSPKTSKKGPTTKAK